MKGTIFFCCSCAIVILSMINHSVGPIVKKKVDITPIYGHQFSVRTEGNTWGTYNCKLLSDYYDIYEETHSLSDNARKYDFEWPINECERKKAMHDMEYTSFILNIIFGMICGLLGLFHLFDLKNEFISKTGLIGLGCGFVGFIFSFIYVTSLSGIFSYSRMQKQVMQSLYVLHFKTKEQPAFQFDILPSQAAAPFADFSSPLPAVQYKSY